MTTIDEIRARDAALHYCAACGNRVYDLADESDLHNMTTEQCEAILAEGGSKPAMQEDIERYGYGPRGLCLDPSAHHPFVEGEPYEQAEIDRRWLLKELDKLAEEYATGVLGG